MTSWECVDDSGPKDESACLSIRSRMQFDEELRTIWDWTET